VRRTLVAAIAVAMLAIMSMSGIAVAASSSKTVTVTLAGVAFNGKANATAKAKVGDKLKFVWKDGFHNVVSTAVPKGAKKVNSGAPTEERAPLTVALTKKGTYSFMCVPHAALGMKIKVAVS
jgi:plastocyanin